MLYDPKAEDVDGWAKRRLEDSLKAITLDQIEAATPQTEPLVPEQPLEELVEELVAALAAVNETVEKIRACVGDDLAGVGEQAGVADPIAFAGLLKTINSQEYGS